MGILSARNSANPAGGVDWNLLTHNNSSEQARRRHFEDNRMSNETVTITDNSTGKEVTLPIYTPTAGPKVIDIGSLYKELGYFTYDPGFMSTAACSSAITFTMATRVYCSIGATRSINWPSTAPISRFVTCC